MYKFAIIGCGRVSSKHFDSILNLNENVKIVACDIDEKILSKVKDRYQNIITYKNYEKMIKNEIPDIVVILTESGKHTSIALNLIKFNIKNIIIEKPIGTNLQESYKLIEEAKKNNVNLFIVKQNRFNKAIKLFDERKEEFGKIRIISSRVRWSRSQSYYDAAKWRGTWKLDGGVITNQASHHLDLLNWLGGGISKVFAIKANFFAKIEAEDSLIASLKFKNGAIGVIEATTAAQPNDIEGSISVLCENGYLEVGGFAVNKILQWKTKNYEMDNEEKIKYFDDIDNVYGEGHKRFYTAIMSSLKKNVTFLIDPKEALEVLQVIHSIYYSVENNIEVETSQMNESAFLGK